MPVQMADPPSTKIGRARAPQRPASHDPMRSPSPVGLVIATLLTTRERREVEAANWGPLAYLHRGSVFDIARDLRRGDAGAVLVSLARLGPADLRELEGFLRQFPASCVGALVSPEVPEGEVVPRVVAVVRCGVRAVADVRSSFGWVAFRGMFDPERNLGFIRGAVARVIADIRAGQGVPDGSHVTSPGAVPRFVEAVFARETDSAKQVAAALHILPSTLMSQFYRRGLPSPKQYVAYGRAVWAAHLLEAPGATGASVAGRLLTSSPQSFGRALQLYTGFTPGTLRRAHTGASMLEMFRQKLILPYAAKLAEVDGFVRPRA